MKQWDSLTAQQRLQQSRTDFIALVADEKSNSHFPRSMTMKWLLNGGGIRMLDYVAAGSVAKLTPRIAGIAHLLPLGGVVKKWWSQLRR